MDKSTRTVIHCVADGKDYEAVERQYGDHGLSVTISPPQHADEILAIRSKNGIDHYKTRYKRRRLAQDRKRKRPRYRTGPKNTVMQFKTGIRMGRGPDV